MSHTADPLDTDDDGFVGLLRFTVQTFPNLPDSQGPDLPLLFGPPPEVTPLRNLPFLLLPSPTPSTFVEGVSFPSPSLSVNDS